MRSNHYDSLIFWTDVIEYEYKYSKSTSTITTDTITVYDYSISGMLYKIFARG